MGFCKFCGEISQGKCAKCGGRAVESIISCMISDAGRVSIVDRWQSRYEGTILNPEELVKKSPTAKRVPVTQSTFYDPKKKLCTCCSKALEFKYTIHMQDGMPYCKDCHLKLFNKGICPTCEKFVSDKHDFIEYSEKVWHKDCFVCFNCHSPLEKDPLVDLDNRPCCEPCFMGQAGRKRAHSRLSIKTEATQSLSHSRNLNTASPPVSSDSVRSSKSSSSASTANSSVSSASSSYGYSRRPRLDREFFTASSPSEPINPPLLTRTPSPEQDEERDYLPDLLSKRLSITPSQKRLTSIFNPPSASKSTSIGAITSAASSNIVNNINTQAKNLPSSSPSLSTSVRNTASCTSNIMASSPSSSSPISLSGSLSKRPCHNCHQPLGDASQKKVKVPLENKEYAWFHKACFVCKKCSLPFKSNECVTDGHYFYHPRCDTQQLFSVCQGCQKSIHQDAFQFNNQAYHFQCFKCYHCASHITLGQPVYEMNDKPYCQFCYSNQRIPTASALETAEKEKRQQSTSAEKRLTKALEQQKQQQQHKRRLPKVGGSKICPRCQQAISFMEDTPGPLATRWHKKCLRCFTCSKQLDSGAKMRQGVNPGESVVYCRNCSI
ncbi:hypothetical protein BDF20DRAFT_879200 [Mycotypha africana]|uniref:uncharacterized protein n=1 Tax=Mycotypha africana TaxID=64632 RepID=UPI002301F712|nr:uncharacterized protein BDF20DRAFT_879200 [Mycotypha africana]KAI8975529.1 hypothetical protein BDF20DRAFT_879200 [Mycotypha africana]